MSKRQRPKTGLSEVMKVNLTKNSISMKQRTHRFFRMPTSKPVNIESEDPEDVYSWLSKFEQDLKEPGKSYQYPLSKFLRSRQISSSQGYRERIILHKNQQRFKRYQAQRTILKPLTVSLTQRSGLIK